MSDDARYEMVGCSTISIPGPFSLFSFFLLAQKSALLGFAMACRHDGVGKGGRGGCLGVVCGGWG